MAVGDYNLSLEVERLKRLRPEGSLLLGLPKLHVLIGDAIPELTAKLRAAIPPGKYLLHIHPPCENVEAFRSRPRDERTLFFEIPKDASLQLSFSIFLKEWLRPDKVDLSVQKGGGSPLLADTAKKITEVLGVEMQNLKVDRMSGLSRLRCSLQNLELLKKSPPQLAKLATPGLPALVCGAGPSLKRQLKLLAENASRFVLVACGHAAIKMQEAGITPDFIVEADPRCRINWAQVETTPKSPLIALLCADPAVTRRFERVLFFEGDCREAVDTCKMLGFRLPKLAISRGVLVTAIDFAFSLGCGRVALVGSDLALGSDGSSHCDADRAKGDELGLVEVDGLAPGSKVVSTIDFLEIKRALETYLTQARHLAAVVNCSASGARLQGLAHLPLEEFLKSLPQAGEKSILFEKLPFPENFAGDLEKLKRTFSGYSALHSDFAKLLRRGLASGASESQLLEAVDGNQGRYGIEKVVPCFASLRRLAEAKAEDVLKESHEGWSFAYEARMGEITASLFSEFADDINCPPERDPLLFKTFRSLACSRLKQCNPELAEALQEGIFPFDGFSTHLRFEDIPQVFKTMPDGSKLPFNGLLSGSGEAGRISEGFAKDFDPKRQTAILIAPGNYALVEEFALAFPSVPFLLVEPWPGLLSELVNHCTFLHRLPEGSQVIAIHNSLKSWRPLLAEFKRSCKEPKRLLNPRTASLPEIQALLAMEEMP